MKVAIITCYKQPDYVRAKTLRAGLEQLDGVDSIIVKNRHKGVLRYPEIYMRLLHLRFAARPDVYIITFRGYEILPFVLMIAGKKSVVLDELINPLLVVNEHRKQRAGTIIGRLMGVWKMCGWFYYWLLRRCKAIIADTLPQAQYSAKRSGLKLEKFTVIPVSTDEELFKPESTPSKPGKIFQVFYYGTMQPLHGLEYIMQAAELLKNRSDIFFLISGPGTAAEQRVKKAQEAGAHIQYESWIQFEKLPELMRTSGVFLAGPFGDTVQSQKVVTGKTYQALACAAPTIVGHSDATELFKDRENCLLVSQGSAYKLADAITWAADHPTELKKIGQAGRHLYEEAFSNKVVAQDLQNLLSTISVTSV